jgi:pSer/pThr/pTyr-binding forkhead associated (FHA) protein
MAKLVLSTGGAIVHQCRVDGDRVGVGREPHNAIVVDDPQVSREHAAIVPVGNDHILEDLDSANGTYVNGTRVARRILQHGDVIELGAYHLRYLNPKVAAEVDLERTMLIEGLGGQTAPRDARAIDGNIPMPVAGPAPIHTRPRGKFARPGPRAGEVIELDRVVTMFGRSSACSAVLVRRPLGYYVAHVDGRRAPRVNGKPIGTEAVLLRHGDIVEAGDERLEFTLEVGDRR